MVPSFPSRSLAPTGHVMTGRHQRRYTSKRWIGSCAGALLVGLLTSACGQGAPDFDVLISGGEIVDGTGAPSFRADVGITGEEIVEIGDLSGRSAATTIDASGLVVSPGFIDIHTHVDAAFERPGWSVIANYLAQGVTTVRPGADGGSDHRITEKKARWEANGLGTNAVLTVGLNDVRGEVLGNQLQPAGAEALDEIRQRIRQAMEEGAWGISAGVEYDGLNIHATTEELVAITEPVAEFDGFYIAHMRDEAAQLLDAIRETIRIGEEAGVRVNVTHFKATGRRNWGLLEDAIELIEEARARGVRITADQYPFDQSAPIGFITELIDVPRDWEPFASLRSRLRDRDLSPEERQDARDAWVEALQAALSDERQRAGLRASTFEPRDVPGPVARWGWHDFRIKVAVRNADLVDANLEELAEQQGRDAFDIVAELVQSEPDILFASGSMSPGDVRAAMQRPWVMISSDGGGSAPGQPGDEPVRGHPRSFASQAIVLRQYVRDENLLTLEEAVRKMTSAPAEFVGLTDRGLLREGLKADIVVFDPAAVTDHATYADSRQLATGVEYVLVNGRLSVDAGQVTGALNGRVLLKPR